MVKKDELRKRLVAYIRKHDVHLTELARDIGIAYNTLADVLKGDGKAYIKTLMKIEDFLDAKSALTAPMEDSFEKGTITECGWVSDGEKWIKKNDSK